MRIDAYNSIGQIYKSNSTKKSTAKSFGVKGDRLELSQIGKDFQAAKAAVAMAPDIRQDLVNDIKSRMDAGTYNVSDSDFAQKLAEKFLGE